MNEIFKRHIEIIKKVNNSTSEKEHSHNEMYLHGFREALRLMDINHIIECDWYYIERGVDRPMCGGVFLDWKESE